MNRPENFIITTDYATLKNDVSSATLSVTIPGSTVVPGNGIYSISDTITIGSQTSNIRARIRSSRDGRWLLGAAVSYDGGYNVLALVTRQSNTQVRLTAIIKNPYSLSLTIAPTSETITAVVSTFLSPFS